MSFRNAKHDSDRQSRTWENWIANNRDALKGIGLPATVYLDDEHWSDFLENGHLHWHDDPSGFEFGHLSKPQMAALLRFLENEYADKPDCPPLLRWVRVRCGQSETET